MLGNGWKRLAIVLGVPYFGWWTFLLIVSPGAYWRSQARLLDADVGDSLVMTVNLRMMQEAKERFDLAITWGIVVPILAILLWIVARWIHNGFRFLKAD